ncbi:Rieske (2Fe-2S) protein [Salicibibacter halophilus]|uniref:Rieske (2Fe-2S) protein n=1 Tax=Salicibibacter halophilus TaxID=2502791 RepID=A0A514LJU1_9BACI|nr:Rieske (2Fe-2S) protein [Salicibibacter halophilus]QDI92092.1 Rieske (2Fe-2S) protein [Salicibibacter halophilus]
MQQVVGQIQDLSPGEMMEAKFDGRPVVICRASDGEFHAFTNLCPHQGAPLSKGKLCGAPEPADHVGEYNYLREGDILRCPWHGREFDIKNHGRMLVKDKQKLREYKLFIEDGNIIMYK